jgi:hypothetical protein
MSKVHKFISDVSAMWMIEAKFHTKPWFWRCVYLSLHAPYLDMCCCAPVMRIAHCVPASLAWDNAHIHRISSA